jgi:hypothetical protein
MVKGTQPLGLPCERSPRRVLETSPSKARRAISAPVLTPQFEGKPPNGQLSSWKEIAVYLGRDIRTAQRWEKHERLPVYRHIHDKAGTVYAFKNEIDAWRQSRSSRPAKTVSPETPRPEIEPSRRPQAALPFRQTHPTQPPRLSAVWSSEQTGLRAVIFYGGTSLLGPAVLSFSGPVSPVTLGAARWNGRPLSTKRST